MFLCDNNSAFVTENSERLKEGKTTLFPPPSSQVIKQIAYSIRLSRMIVLLSNSTICVYRLFKETALLEKIQEAHEVLDSEGKRSLT
jgi:hypothetical protein